MYEPRRVRTAYVTKHHIIWCFLTQETGFPVCKEPGSTNLFRRLKFPNLPADVTINYGWYDAARDAFGISIEHPSFDEVPFGEVPPQIEAEVEEIFCNEEGHVQKRATEISGWRHSKSLL